VIATRPISLASLHPRSTISLGPTSSGQPLLIVTTTFALRDDGSNWAELQGGQVALGGGGGWRHQKCRHCVILHISTSKLSQVLCRLFFCNRKQVTVDEAYVYGQQVMGRADRRLGKLIVGSPEDRRFRAFFGVSAEVSVEAWRMMADHGWLPPKPNFRHFLWALAFMRTYPPNDSALS
jgi:hypothetical protein